MECGPGVETGMVEEIEREMGSGMVNFGRGEGSVHRPVSASSSLSHSSEASPTREASMEDVIGCSKPDDKEKKVDEKKKSALRRVFGGLGRSKKSSQGEDKSRIREGGESETVPSKSLSLSRMFQKVTNRPSFTKIFGGGSSDKGEGVNLSSEHKPGTSKTLGRLINYMGPVKLHSKKTKEACVGVEQGTKPEQGRTMTLGRRIAENFGSTLKGFRSSNESQDVLTTSEGNFPREDKNLDRTLSNPSMSPSDKV